MTETKNPAIKLFGKRIKLPLSPEGVSPSLPPVDSVEKEAEEEDDGETEQNPYEEQAISINRKEGEPSPSAEGPISPQDSPDSVNPKTPPIDEETSESKFPKTGKAPKDSPKPQEKALKKPDKILPCPRCNSMETKFCYYNNYNVNQPRHFCKSCQRYWTAGGTMRNVPVGAGRRKSKSSASRYRHISISEALQAVARVDPPNGTLHHCPSLTPNATVLNFELGHHDPVPLQVEKRAAGTLNGPYCYNEQGTAKVSHERGDNRDDHSSRIFPNERPISNLGRAIPQVPCLNSVPWPYSVPISFYPTGFWACGNVGIANAWNFPLVSPPSLISAPNSPVLGKHPREEDMIKANGPVDLHAAKPKNGSVLIPKTLRIDDPNEAAKSSIWATLGIKSECETKGGLFKGFQPKGKENEKVETETEKCWVLCSNPAALSRSLNFHEST